MSCPKNRQMQVDSIQVEIEDLVDSFVGDGDLDVEEHKIVETHPLGHRDCNYAFNTREGFSFRAHIYWVNEDGHMRQYFHMELALTKIAPAASTPMLIFALERNQCIPAPIRLALSDDLIILSSRFAVNGLTDEYARDIICGLIPFGAKIMEDLRTAFGEIPSVIEALGCEERRAGLH